MKNKKVITLIMAAAASCSSVYAATLPTSEVDAYILAMNTMSPITAKYLRDPHEFDHSISSFPV